MTKITKKIITFMLMALMLLTMPLTAFAEDETAKAPFDANGKYNARLGIQATTADGQIWLARIGYYSSKDDGDKVTSDKKLNLMQVHLQMPSLKATAHTQCHIRHLISVVP